MRVIASYKMSRLNVPFRNRLMEYLITRYFEENKIPDTWAEETDTIKEELDIPAQLIISRLFGGWLDAVVNHVNQGTPLTEEELVEYPHQMDDLYDSYSFESDKEYHRDFSGYMDQTAWEFMSKAAEYLTEDEMLGTIWQVLSDIGAEVYGTLKALQPAALLDCGIHWKTTSSRFGRVRWCCSPSNRAITKCCIEGRKRKSSLGQQKLKQPPVTVSSSSSGTGNSLPTATVS